MGIDRKELELFTATDLRIRRGNSSIPFCFLSVLGVIEMDSSKILGVPAHESLRTLRARFLVSLASPSCSSHFTQIAALIGLVLPCEVSPFVLLFFRTGLTTSCQSMLDTVLLTTSWLLPPSPDHEHNGHHPHYHHHRYLPPLPFFVLFR